MKIIYKINSDNTEVINKLAEQIKHDVILPMDTDLIRCFVISDTGQVTELK